MYRSGLSNIGVGISYGIVVFRLGLAQFSSDEKTGLKSSTLIAISRTNHKKI